MPKIHYIDSMTKGIFINFADGEYGFFPCGNEEVVPLGNKIRFGDCLISTVYLRYINNFRFRHQDEELADRAREAFGNTVNRLRNERGWSERDLALHLLNGDDDTKVNSKKSHISRWIHGKVFPAYTSIEKLADAFEMEVVGFLHETSKEYWKLIGDMEGL